MAIRTGIWIGLALTLAAPAWSAEQLAGLPPADGFPAAPPREEISFPTPSVTAVKVGRHGARTRVTLDLTGPAEASLRTTPSGRSLLLGFTSVDWRAKESEYRTGGLISRFRFGATEKGGDLALIASEAVQVAEVRHLPPARRGAPYHLEIDLVPARLATEAETPTPPPSFGTTTVRLSR